MPRLSAAEFHAKGYDPRGQWCLLHGPEHELKLRARDAIIQHLVSPQDREYAVQTIAIAKGGKASTISSAAQTASTFTPARVLVVDWVENLSNAEQRELARDLAAAPGTTVILIEGPRGARAQYEAAGAGDRKGRLSAELIRAISEVGSVVECRALTRDEAVARVVEHARSLGAAMKPAVAALLVERVGLDLGRLAREVEKLSLLASGEGAITRQHIEQATPRTPEDSIFAVGDAIGVGDVDQALGALRDLLHYQGVEPTTALAFIGRQFRLLWQMRILLDAGWRPGGEAPEQAAALLPEEGEILGYLDGRRWLVNRLAAQSRRFSWLQLAHAVRRVLEAELALKGIGEGVSDPRLALELLVADLCKRRG
jgi:DNA polymerase-3 subunit delta